MKNSLIKDLLMLKSVGGLYGIEVEMETENSLFDQDGGSYAKIGNVWRYEEDGSLKYNGSEWVSKVLKDRGEVKSAVESLYKFINNTRKMYVMDSVRAGVHVHVNFQNKTTKQLLNFLACYYPIESALTNFCGEARTGNLFCMRLRDAPATVLGLCKVSEGKGLGSIQTDGLRYSALNLQSLFKYGTIEFRALRTPKTPEKILEWVEIIEALVEYSDKMTNPLHPLSTISGEGALGYLKEVFPEEIVNKLKYDGLEQDSIRDVREAQQFIYSI